MAKLLLIMLLGGALLEGLGSSQSEPPLLIDASHSVHADPLDAVE
jgi:hypothetical protein